ncbi:transaldolase [Rhodococcus sp. NPDC057529]|uniref:transaldolase n=1 Tax=Rhodococcus sp. NPDC057529 TaxID=3346158 RepID=UPI0036716D73
MTPSPTAQLTSEGVSIWLDDLSRDQLDTGTLRELIETRNVVGVTTNPTIFATALARGSAYSSQIADLARQGVTVEEAVFQLTTEDVARACEVLRPRYDASGGRDGRVSIEVPPELAHDADATVAEARRLVAAIDRPNLMVKIPATTAGLEATAAVLAEGISVNVTLIFGLDRYNGVVDAYLDGLERAQAAGLDISKIHSVASFFVSRVDAEVDKRLSALDTESASALISSAGVANARLAYQAFEQRFATSRARALLGQRANLQRPLWASTGVKDASLDDTTYVVELVAPTVVNTMPATTLEATFDHGNIRGNTIASNIQSAQEVLLQLESLGIAMTDVAAQLEREGLDKFAASWNDLLRNVGARLDAIEPALN